MIAVSKAVKIKQFAGIISLGGAAADILISLYF